MQMDDIMQKKISSITANNTGDLQSTSNREPEMTRKIEAWDSLYQSLTKLTKCKTHKELFNKLPNILSSLIIFDRISIILINDKLASIFEGVANEMEVRKVFYNGGWIKVLTVSSYPCSNPQFHSLGQILIGKKR
jgi:hypothetical protein